MAEGIIYQLVCLTLLIVAELNGTSAQFFFNAFNDVYRLSTLYPEEGIIQDEKIIQKEYDFVVIGAGSGGSVVANRLTEKRDWEVLLLEAGGDETFLSDIPLLAALTQITSLNWGYKTEHVPGACMGLSGGVCNWPRGRVLGGTSVINFLLYSRGNRLDYNEWEALGNTGWGYDDVLPYFIKSEKIGVDNLKGSPYHGTNGYLNVEQSPFTTELHKAFRKASGEMGYKYNDPNGRTNLGFSKALATMRNGRRCSASRAFLEPIRFRKNFHVSKKSRVTKILINPETKRAYGVEFIKNRRKHVVYAKKEIILGAGTIGSAQLLMLSGIGPRENLESVGIPVIKDSMVGFNLQDHLCLSGVVFFVNQSVTVSEKSVRTPSAMYSYMMNRKGPYTVPGGAEGVAFMKTKYAGNQNDDYPDIELVMGTGGLNGDASGSLRELLGIPTEFYDKMYGDIKDRETFAINPVLLRPRSRGRISLKSANPFHWPVMQPMYLNDPHDLRVLREGAKLAVKISQTSGFKKYNATIHKRHFPGCEQLTFESDEYWECSIRHITTTLNHQSGTAKMGPLSDPTAVVDPTLKVIGITGLRVVDASIIPIIPTGHTNAIVFMIGEKASDMIKRDWGVFG